MLCYGLQMSQSFISKVIQMSSDVKRCLCMFMYLAIDMFKYSWRHTDKHGSNTAASCYLNELKKDYERNLGTFLPKTFYTLIYFIIGAAVNFVSGLTQVSLKLFVSVQNTD